MSALISRSSESISRRGQSDRAARISSSERYHQIVCSELARETVRRYSIPRRRSAVIVDPQEGAEPERFADLGFRHFFLQPMDGPAREANTRAALRYCLSHPRWRLSLQTHKLLGIP